eukprot:gene17300-23609_t
MRAGGGGVLKVLIIDNTSLSNADADHFYEHKERSTAASALELEKIRFADALEKERVKFANALEKERRAVTVAVEKERFELERVLETRVRAGVAQGCAEERVQLQAVEALLAALRDREIEKEVARRTVDTKVLRMQLADLEREMEILRRSNSARGAVGEERISSFLRREWPTSEVRDMSQSPHTCELWWYCASNKGGGGGDSFCRSSNGSNGTSPHRGRVGFNSTSKDDDRDGGGDLVWLKGVLNVFLTVTHYEHNRAASSSRVSSSEDEDRRKHNTKAMVARLSKMVEHVGRVRSFVHNVRTTHLAAALNLTAKADVELRELFSNLADVCKEMDTEYLDGAANVKSPKCDDTSNTSAPSSSSSSIVFVVLTLFVGMALIIHGIYEEKFQEMNKNVRVEYRFLPRTLYEEQLSKQDSALTAKFKNMFQEDSPWK